ncbi:MAG TPA: biotin/lipoyl-containing protein, partial [Geodermatophilus sp.]|nr:biotin/lipoyl-containing protein [Geodermatophilus sp.]
MRIPDIGDFADVPVIEVHVAPGDVVAAEDPVLTLESDKATMDIPAPADGTVDEVLVEVGSRVSPGDLVLRMTESGAGAPPATHPVTHEDAVPAPVDRPGYGSDAGVYERIEVTVPHLGDFADVPVVEVHVAPGDVVAAEDPVLTLESDKATMDIPAPASGTVEEVLVQVGSRVSTG